MIGSLRRSSLAGLVWGLLLLDGSASAQSATERPPPLEVGLEERVDVRLVLVDLVVLDRDGRTVPDLDVADFTVVVSGRELPIHSLDRDCPVGAARDPLPGKRSKPSPPASAARPRRLVLVFDYFHMIRGNDTTGAARTFDYVSEMLDKWPSGGEEHMVVSLGDALRVEAPFTADLGEVRRTVERMRHDRDLYGGNYGRLTERRFFDRIAMLFDLLERWEGRKTIVLFSGPFMDDGFHRDPEFKSLSALATATRTAVYPVDTGGLRTSLGPGAPPFGGPPMLRRLANETGGRMTSETNEIGLAYAKAQRDLGCTYTIGFHDPRPEADRERRLTIHVNERRGLRLVYPQFYVVRSPEEKRKSLFRTAAMTPEPFESEAVTTDLVLLAPRSSSSWRARLAVEVRLDPRTWVEPGETWELKGLLRKPNGTVLHSFREELTLPQPDPVTGSRAAVTLVHELNVRPGRYTVSAVLCDPRAETPLAATRPVIVAEVPPGATRLRGPIPSHGAAGIERRE